MIVHVSAISSPVLCRHHIRELRSPRLNTGSCGDPVLLTWRHHDAAFRPSAACSRSSSRSAVVLAGSRANFGPSICTSAAPPALSSHSVSPISSLQLRCRSSRPPGSREGGGQVRGGRATPGENRSTELGQQAPGLPAAAGGSMPSRTRRCRCGSPPASSSVRLAASRGERRGAEHLQVGELRYSLAELEPARRAFDRRA